MQALRCAGEFTCDLTGQTTKHAYMSELQRKRTSRKGKKAWRKNVDVTDIDLGLEAARDRHRIVGTTDADFVIDQMPSANLMGIRPLKTQEILANKSRVPAVNPRKSRTTKSTRAKRTDVLRLVLLTGGKYKEENPTVKRIENDGIVRKMASVDLWGEPGEIVQDPTADFPAIIEHTAPKHPPSTIKVQPITVRAYERIPHSGKSYNPLLELWKELIGREHGIELQLEVARQHAESNRARIAHLMETLKDQTGFLSSEEELENEGNEEQVEGHEEKNYTLLINRPTIVKKKTRAKRNRLEKHKHREQAGRELSQLRQQLKDFTNIEGILAKYVECLERPCQATAAKKLKRPKLFKHEIGHEPLEVKLSLELTNRLKNLKPEGNLLYDQMAILQLTGKIESRVPIAKRRKYTKKITEKWTYKDFK